MEKNEIIKAFTDIFTNIKISGNQLYANCIFCGLSKNNKPHLSIDLSDDYFRYHCFRCNSSGNIFKLCKYFLNSDYYETLYTNLLTFNYLNNKNYYDNIIKNYCLSLRNNKGNYNYDTYENTSNTQLTIKPTSAYDDKLIKQNIYKLTSNKDLYNAFTQYLMSKFHLKCGDYNDVINFIKRFRVNTYINKNNQLVVEYYYALNLYKQIHYFNGDPDKIYKVKVKNYKKQDGVNLNIFDYYIKIDKNKTYTNDKISIYLFEGISDLISFYYLINNNKHNIKIDNKYYVLISVDGKSNIKNIPDLIDIISIKLSKIGISDFSRYHISDVNFLFDKDVDLNYVIDLINKSNIHYKLPLSEFNYYEITGDYKDINQLLIGW